MGNAVSAKAADEREARRKQERKEEKKLKRERQQKRLLLKQKPKFDKSGNPLHYDKHGNQFFYDNKGNPYYIDEAGSHFYVDDHGAPFYLDENQEPFYLDENRAKFYLDENREPFYLDKRGQKYFLDTEGKKYYFDENGNPYLADNESDKYTDDAGNLSDMFKERRMGVLSTRSTEKTASAPFSETNAQICSTMTPVKTGTPASIRTLIHSSATSLTVGADTKGRADVIDHCTVKTRDSERTFEATDQHLESIPSNLTWEDTETVSVKTDTLSSYSSLSFTKSEFEQEIAITPDYIKDNTKESETRITAQIEAENKILKKQLARVKELELLPSPKSFRKVGTFNIKLADDIKDCSAIGQAFLSDGSLVIADSSNRKIKLFNSELEPAGSYDIDYSPQGLCSGAKDNLVHVTFKTRMFNGINIFKVNDKSITSQKTIQTKGVPFGIARSNEGLAVIISNQDGWQIHLMTLKGTISRVINLENNFFKLTNPEYITITKDIKLFISDGGSNLVYCIDTNGEELFQYQQLRDPKGLCTDNKGSIYITSPGVVHQISTSGERIKALMRREVTGFAAHGVCYDSEDSLMVLTGQSNTLVAFELTD